MSEEQLKEEDKQFATQLAKIISDPDFLQIYTLNEQPNLFRAVARTHTETWHSAFLGWLLDPGGSHQLGDFPLIRFLVAVANEAWPPSDSNGTPSKFEYILSPPQLAALAITRDFSNNTVVIPSEKTRKEKTIGTQYGSNDCEDVEQRKDDGGRIDVWIEDIKYDTNAVSTESIQDRFVCIVEEKIKATVGLGQARKYADYLKEGSKTNSNLRGVCVLLSPECEDIGCSYELAEDERWYCLSFQSLHDYVLSPCLEHPDMDPEMAVCLRHYIRNLKMGINGRSLAMSKEEHELARKVVDKYGDTLKMLAKVLKEIKGVSDLDDELSPNPLRILIPGERPIEGGTVPELFTNILKWLQDTDRLDKLEIPLASGKALYILSEEAKHPNGKPFNKSRLCFRSNGRDLYMNTNYSHNGGLRVGVKLLQHAGITNAKALSLDEEE